ncbi:thiamine phosphate synthase, partial [Clostridium sp. cpc1]|nr:thiamine phosphate synthase [Clostridium sp. cpc1]
VYRIIDANINRVSEGLRVIEDIERFIFEDGEISREIREIRHLVRKGFSSLELIKSREASKDVGLKTSKESSLDRKESIEDLIVSNFKRVEEGLRSIEECLKIIEYYEESKAYEELRFKIYTLEKKVFLNMKKDDID